MPPAVFGEILRILGVFLSPDFHLSPPARQLGLGDPGGLPGVSRLSPSGWSADFLLTRRENLPHRPGFLSTLEFIWSAPQAVTVAELERAFGPGRLVLGTDNEDEDRFEIELSGHPLRGLLAVEIEAGTFGESLETRNVRLVRIAPPPFLPADAARQTVVLLDDFGATRRTDGRPLSATLSSRFGVEDLMNWLEPVIDDTMSNLISPGESDLPVRFRPNRLAHLDPDVAPRLLPELAPLYDLRDGLRDVTSGGLRPPELRKRIRMESLPPEFRDSVNGLIKEGKPAPATLLARVQDALAAQAAEFTNRPSFLRLFQAWSHLAELNEALDTRSDGTLLRVFPASGADAGQILRAGPVDEELNHPEGPPLLAVVLGPGLVGRLGALELRDVAEASQRVETLLWADATLRFQLAAPAERPEPLVLPPLRKIVRRVETQFLAGAPAGDIEAAVAAALVARHPGSAPRVQLIRAPGAPARLSVEMPLPGPAAARPIVFRYDANWHDYR